MSRQGRSLSGGGLSNLHLTKNEPILALIGLDLALFNKKVVSFLLHLSSRPLVLYITPNFPL